LDRETPVSLYQRFSARAIFLLESAALGEATGRYSFIGLDRRWRVTTREGATVVEGPTAATRRSRHWTRFATSWLDTALTRLAPFPTSLAAPSGS